MLKKIMFWVMVLVAALRVSSIFTLLFRGATNLPAMVVVISSAACVAMVVLLARSASQDGRRSLELGYLLNGSAVALNLLLVCFGTPATIDLTEMMAIGTFFDLLLTGTMLVLSHKQTRYVTVHNV